ncbi:unnamed protein product, partial [Vitis vinifera]|uniref:Secreted protein n=1 Tax=Vitis vinifera TaxID=29760 RepID=D7T9D0_VITVI
MAAGKAFLIICFILFILPEVLVVCNWGSAPKSVQACFRMLRPHIECPSETAICLPPSASATFLISLVNLVSIWSITPQISVLVDIHPVLYVVVVL